MNEVWIERIDAYLNGKMNGEEQLSFERELEQNKELSSLLSMYKIIEGTMRDAQRYHPEEAALKQTFCKFNDQFFNTAETTAANQQQLNNVKLADGTSRRAPLHAVGKEGAKVKKFQGWKSWAVAASVLSIVILSGTLLMQDNQEDPVVSNLKKSDSAVASDQRNRRIERDTSHRPPSALIPSTDNLAADNTRSTESNGRSQVPRDRRNRERSVPAASINTEALFAQNFKQDEVPANQPQVLQGAFELYEAGDYEEAAASFSTANPDMVTRGSGDDKRITKFDINYYTAQSYLAMGKAEKAKNELELAISNSPTDSLKAKAQWYLALAYLKTGDQKNAKDLLDQLVNGPQTQEISRAKKLRTQLHK